MKRKWYNDAPLPDRRDPYWDELPWERRRRLAEEEAKVEAAIKVELEARAARQKELEARAEAAIEKAEHARRIYEAESRRRNVAHPPEGKLVDIGGDGRADGIVAKSGDRYVVRNMRGDVLYVYDDIWEQGS